MSSDNNNNWLGFSLSGPGMEHGSSSSADHQHQQQQDCSNAVSDTIPLNFNYPGIYYGVEGENVGYYSNLTMMPIRSDGSLCLMEAINRSHVQVQPQGKKKDPIFFTRVVLNLVEVCNCL